MDTVIIRDESIRLGQAMKMSGMAATGADAKQVIRDGMVTVNGSVETRRGRKLREGDCVTFQGESFRVEQSAGLSEPFSEPLQK